MLVGESEGQIKSQEEAEEGTGEVILGIEEEIKEIGGIQDPQLGTVREAEEVEETILGAREKGRGPDQPPRTAEEERETTVPSQEIKEKKEREKKTEKETEIPLLQHQGLMLERRLKSKGSLVSLYWVESKAKKTKIN